MKLKYKKADIVNFYELSEEWQKEAISNLGDDAEFNYYLYPDEDSSPEKHILRDLSECMPIDEGDFNACIGISNNSAMLLGIDDNFESCKYKFV